MLKNRLFQGVVAALIVVNCTLAVAGAHAGPLGLPPDEQGEVSPTALVALGQRLFSDKRLSVDGSVSCATCHIPEKRFTDGLPTAHGLHGQTLARHTPSLLNVRYASSLFWDGRSSDLASQARSPLLAAAEHGLADERSVGTILAADPGYVTAFERLFGVVKDRISIREASEALAIYERTLLAADSPFDRYEYAGEEKAMSPAAVRGLNLFRGHAQCASCHSIGKSFALFTDGQFHSSPLPLSASTSMALGELSQRVNTLRSTGQLDTLNALVEMNRDAAELGRFIVSLNPKDIGRFRTPSLRNVAATGPYMHDGSVKSLSQAVDLELYGRTEQRYPLVLTEDERADLLEFLRALTSP
jgi:cytochrome c peroxidase